MATNNQTMKFELSDGYIELNADNLIITDKAKKDRLLLLLSTVTSVLLALSLLYRWTITGDTYYSVIGFILLVTNLGLLWKWYKEFRFVENHIQLSDIECYKLVNIKLSGIKVGLIKTKYSNVRRIKMKSNEFDKFRLYIEEKNIRVI